MQVQEPVVIHRTSNCIVMTGNQPQSRQQKQRVSSQKVYIPQDNMNKGWQAPNDKPYVALGDFQNVISVVEGLKHQIHHSKEMSAETQKMIQKVKRSHNPLFKSGRPDRTLKILSRIPEQQQAVKYQSKHVSIGANFIDLKGIGEVDSTSIMKKMKALEEQFLTSAVNFNDLQHKQLNQKNLLLGQQNDNRSSISNEALMSNQRLITPALRKLMNTKDASIMLKDEIQESQLRLKAAKYGHRLDEIAPAYDHSFYLPDKTLYFDKSNSNVRTSKSLNKQSARDANSQHNKSLKNPQMLIPSYVTKNQNENSVAFMTEPSQNMFNSQNQARDSQQNIQDYIRTRAGFGNANEGPSIKGGNSTFFDSFNNRNNKSFYSQKPDRSRELSQNQQDSTFFNQAFRTYDGINKLSPKKPKKLNELSTKYRDTFMKIDETGQDRQGRRQHNSMNPKLPNLNQSSFDSKPVRLHQTSGEQDQPTIRFVSMIDSRPVIPAYLNLVPLKQFNKKESEITRIVAKEQTQGQPVDPMDPTKTQQASQFNWGKMLNEDLDEMMKKKIDKLQEDIMQKKLIDQVKKKAFVSHISEAQNSTLDTHPHDHQTAQIDGSSSPNSNQLSKIQLMLLQKLISFESLDTFNAEDLMKKLYNFFFNWQKEIGADEGSGSLTNKNFEIDSDGKGGRGNFNDDQEEKRKRLQLKLDQELIEFEERGGFAKVLKDIFNPTDFSSMELDSVFQLKALCKTFYEKKERLSTSLVQTLDAMSNERPKTLLMKKNNLNLDMKNGNLYDDIEWMRINAEKQRIQQYRDIAKDCAYFYYKVLKRFVEENANYEKERASEKNNNLLDPQIKMKMIHKEKVLKDILSYITDYMRAVIENGSKFTKEHFFKMLNELNADHIELQLAKYLKIMIEELEMPAQEFEDFLNSMSNERLADAYFTLTDVLFKSPSQ